MGGGGEAEAGDQGGGEGVEGTQGGRGGEADKGEGKVGGGKQGGAMVCSSAAWVGEGGGAEVSGISGVTA